MTTPNDLPSVGTALPPLPDLGPMWTPYWTKFVHVQMQDYALDAIRDVVSERDELASRVAELEAEVLDQCRLNGMGAERESALMGRVREMEGERDRAMRNRDMWKGQCERQAETLGMYHAKSTGLERDGLRYRYMRDLRIEQTGLPAQPGAVGEIYGYRYSRNGGRTWALMETDPTDIMPDEGGIVIPLVAAPTEAKPAQPCGHQESLLLKSAETGEPLYCEACDDKSGRRDAEQRETELLAANQALREKIAALSKPAQDAVDAEPKSLNAKIADQLRPFLKPGDKVIWREAFRWHDDNGVMPNHYDGMSVAGLADEFGYQFDWDFNMNHAAIVRAAKGGAA